MSHCEETGMVTRRPLGKEAEGPRRLEMVTCGIIKQESQNGLIGKVKLGQRWGEGPKPEPQSRAKAIQGKERNGWGRSLGYHLLVNSDG